MATVSFRNVSKTFNERVDAVRQLNLEVRDQEFLALLGPSGSGKSTTLRLLAGLDTPTSGDIFIDGVRVNDFPPSARGVGMVFQSFALYPHMTAAENISFGLRMAKQKDRLTPKEIESRVAEIASLLEIERELERKPRELSGGQKQRVAIGRALVRRPRVLLMDEPLSNLDANLKEQMRHELRRLHSTHGTTTLYVTHDQVEAMSLAHRIAVMREGSLQQCSAPDSIYDDPANPFVAAFIGTPAMNLIDGIARDGWFTSGELKLKLPAHLAKASGRGRYGIRPEFVRIDETDGICATIRAVERRGADAVVSFDVHGHAVRMLWRRTDADSSGRGLAENTVVQLDLTHGSARFFERADDASHGQR